MRTDAPVRELKGIGPKAADLFAQKGIFTVGDLLGFWPSRYEFFEEAVGASEAEEGAVCALCLSVTGTGGTVRKGGRTITHIEAADASGQVRLTFFNMPYVSKTLRPGAAFVFRGTLHRTRTGIRYMEQPWFADPARYAKLRGTLQPRYPLGKGIGQERMRAFLAAALRETDGAPEDVPEDLLSACSLLPRHAALRGIHFPRDRQELAQARRRLVFDEFLSFIVGMRRLKAGEGERGNPRPMQDGGDWCGRFLRALPFSLTAEQARAWEEIRADLCGGHRMNRLLQGDVGSGKTVLAFLALVLCAQNGRQGVLMAPTEILARQHMEGFSEYVSAGGLPIRPVLLTGSVKGRERRAVLQSIADGSAQVVIGTHALFQEKVAFFDPGLVVTDEQHRFGVVQRAALAAKGEDVPVLVMSATPIPRTLAIILYGELQVSSLRALPPGRLPVKSLALPQAQRGRAYRFLLGEIAKGRQCYVICPAVGDGEAGDIGDMENVRDYADKLERTLPRHLRIDTLTGRMRPEEKAAAMERFARGGTDILVSTTVIEVGINVPNATLILVENAERFGLSQLHQLRGRVGRGAIQSYCIFLYAGKEKPGRLEVLEKNADGFSIADADLKARGPGDLYGVRQSGMPQFTLADIYEDADILREAAACADELLHSDPGFRSREGVGIDPGTI